ncbi:hypothetical protein CK219_05270 [Mesorhizobium sp. WSM4313]|nr:hypothetical protein CK219_05270 [Mesorhizobium sp. WSM4313]
MALSSRYFDRDIAFSCPYCTRITIRKGQWIKSAHSFTCEGCDNEVRLTYSFKLKIFEDHERSSR